jgi:membrane fusion protein (multidrug efflux system)
MKFISPKHVFSIAAIVSIWTLISCGEKKTKEELAKQAKPSILSVEAYIVKPQPFQSDYTASGVLYPNEEVKIMPEVAGRVTSITFNEGTIVEQGQTLLKIYNEDIKAQIEKLQAQRELQIKIKNRQAELLHIGGISQQDYETTTTQIQSIDADIAYSRAMLRKTTINAPFHGKIGIRNVSVGAVVTPSTIIATLQQTRILKMDFTVPDQYRSEVLPGKKITFSLTGQRDTFLAVISAMEPAANEVTHTLKIRALVQNQDHKLVAGSFTHVIVPFENKKDAILIPSQSVIPTDREKLVAVVKDGKASMVPVVVGTRTSDNVEILQGINPGDSVLTTGIMQVKQGMTVHIKAVH